jgi:hypothetical protein
MRASKHARRFLFTILLCVSASFWSCGRKQTAPLSEGTENLPEGAKPGEFPIDQQIEQKLDPLTKNDLELYLKVMRTAAERVKHPTPADQAALDGARKILAGGASGRVPTPDGVKTLERANLVAIAMDQIVAEELKLDGRTYRGIAEAVESVIPNPALGTESGNGGVRAAQAAGQEPTPLEKRLNEVNNANLKFLTPFREEIQKLISVVRNPANLPK